MKATGKAIGKNLLIESVNEASRGELRLQAGEYYITVFPITMLYKVAMTFHCSNEVIARNIFGLLRCTLWS